MRIIAGYLKGRTFDSPRSSHTHPMSDKIRGALFNILGDIEGLNILDAFSGSGAIAFEAISRGAASATLIESDQSAQGCIAININNLGLKDLARLGRTNTDSWLTKNDDKFDIVISDPPYDDLQADTILKLANRTNPGGVLVLSLPPAAEISLPSNFQNLVNKSYGDAELRLYRQTKT